MQKIGLVCALLILLSAVSGCGRVSYEPINLGPDVNTQYYEGSPDISADGKSLYFDVLALGGPRESNGWDIWVAYTKTPYSNWEKANPLPEPINSLYSEAGPSISKDDLTLYFASNRPGGYGSFDIYMSTRKTKNDQWGEPVNLGPSVNSTSEDNHPSISADGLSLYFDSTRSYNRDIYVVKRETIHDEWSKSGKDEAESLGEAINTQRIEFAPDISSDGLTLYYDSRTTDRDVYIAKRATKESEWEKGVRLEEPYNTSFIDSDPSISINGKKLFFMSARPDGNGLFDIWKINIK